VVDEKHTTSKDTLQEGDTLRRVHHLHAQRRVVIAEHVEKLCGGHTHRERIGGSGLHEREDRLQNRLLGEQIHHCLVALREDPQQLKTTLYQRREMHGAVLCGELSSVRCPSAATVVVVVVVVVIMIIYDYGGDHDEPVERQRVSRCQRGTSIECDACRYSLTNSPTHPNAPSHYT
jgi:hypothetical protein